MIFWVLEQRRKWREEAEQRLTSLRMEVRAEGRAEVRREFEERLENVAREKRISLEELLLN